MKEEEIIIGNRYIYQEDSRSVEVPIIDIKDNFWSRKFLIRYNQSIRLSDGSWSDWTAKLIWVKSKELYPIHIPCNCDGGPLTHYHIN